MDAPFPLKHGRLLITTIANPAAQAGFTYTVSARLIEQLYAIQYIIDTDGNAANRRINFEVDDSTAVIATFNDNIDVILNTITRQSWLINAPAILDTAPAVTHLSTHFLPPDFIMPLGGTLSQFISNAQAGDQISAIRVVTKVWSRT